MADTFTPNYNLVLPGIGGDVNTWGTLLNGNFSAIDTGMAANVKLDGTRPMTGNLKLSKTTPAVTLLDTSQTLPAGAWQFQSSSNHLQLLRNTAVAGDFSTSTTPLQFDNADFLTLAGGVSIAGNLSVSGTATITGTLNVTTGGIFAAGGIMGMGASSLNAENDLIMWNTNTHAQWFLNASGIAGFYDIGRTQVRFNSDTSGNFSAAGNVTAYSDERLKTDWKPLPQDFVEMAAQATTGTYMRKDTGERQAGTIAQEWLSILGEVVGTDPLSGLYTMAYGNAALMLAMELAKRVIALEARFLDELK